MPRHLSFRWQHEGLCCSLCNPVALADFETCGVRIVLAAREAMHPDGFFKRLAGELSICIGCLLSIEAARQEPFELERQPLEGEVSALLDHLDKARGAVHLLRQLPTGDVEILCGYPGTGAVASFEPETVTCLDCLRALGLRPL